MRPVRCLPSSSGSFIKITLFKGGAGVQRLVSDAAESFPKYPENVLSILPYLTTTKLEMIQKILLRAFFDSA
jgi:hypothetical protein